MQPQERQPPRERRPARRRVQHAGVLVPWANSVVEAELPRWAGTSVTWHYARLVPPSLGTALDEDFLAGLLAAVPAALGQLAALPLQRVYLACTSAAFVFPGQVPDGDRRLPACRSSRRLTRSWPRSGSGTATGSCC